MLKTKSWKSNVTLLFPFFNSILFCFFLAFFRIFIFIFDRSCLLGEDWDNYLSSGFLGRAFLKLNDIPHDGNLVKLLIPLKDTSGINEDIPRGHVELALSWVHDDFKAVLEQSGGDSAN